MSFWNNFIFWSDEFLAYDMVNYITPFNSVNFSLRLQHSSILIDLLDVKILKIINLKYLFELSEEEKICLADFNLHCLLSDLFAREKEIFF